MRIVPWRTLSSHVVALGAVLALAGCSAENITGDDGPPAEFSASSLGEKVSVCHQTGYRHRILTIGAEALPDHAAHGDYVTTLLVDRDGTQPADGMHFRRITDALAAAREGRLARGELVTAACRITIRVAAGMYSGTTASPAPSDLEQFPLLVDVPDLTLRGAFEMGLDGRFRATGMGTGGGATTLTPVAPLPVVNTVSTPIILANAHPDGSAGNGLTVEGFIFQSGNDPAGTGGGQGVLSVRASGITIRGNRFEGGFTESIDLRAGSGAVVQNHLGGTAGTCDICLAGPGRYVAVGNRLLAGGIPGITVDGPVGLPVPVGIEPYVLPATAETFAHLVNNEIRDHLRSPVGTGIRLDALGVLGSSVQSTVRASIWGNTLVNNRFGIIAHAAFPRAGTPLRGDLDAVITGNQIEQSCQAKLLVSFSRHTTTLGLSAQPYLQNSTFRFWLGPDLSWDEAWYGHPDGFGNTLVVNGQVQANGVVQAYDAVGCPGL